MTPYLHVVINIFCIAILTSMFLHSFQFTNNSKEQWVYRHILISAVLFAVADIAFFYIKNSIIEVNSYVMLAGHAIKRSILACVSFCWYRYSKFILNGKIIEDVKGTVVGIGLIVAIVISCVIGGITGAAFELHDNVIVINAYFRVLTGVLSLAMILVGLVKTLKKRLMDKTDGDKTKYQRGAVFNLYPLLFAAGQQLISGLPLICMGITLASINSYTIKRLMERNKSIDISSVERFQSLFISSCYVDVTDNTYIFVGDEKNNPLRYTSPKYDEMIYGYVEQTVHPADRQNFVEKCSTEYMLKRLSFTEPFFFFDFRRRMNGEYRWHRMHVVIAATDDNGEPINILLSNMYIDDVKQNEYRYQEQLEMASKSKSDFLSNVSHELRTPMNAIMGIIKLLEQDAEDPGKVRDDVRKLQASGRHLLSVINDVLDMNKIERGIFVINSAEFDLSMLLEDINTVMLQLTREKKQNFRMELCGVKNNRLVGDKARLSQILINILTNSTKYTPSGGEMRLIVRQMEAEEGCHLQFEIWDSGIGMESEFLKRVFEPFAREEERIPTEASGTGLGMAITKNLVDLMNGTIHVESEPGKGSKFVVDIDFGIANEIVQTIEGVVAQTEETKKTLAGMNFLIAEDNEINGEIITRLLELDHATATVCPNGKKVVEMFLSQPENTYDIILMDIRMPVMNGYEATKAIRACGRADAETIPILSLTANAFSEDVDMAIAAGMNGHIPKPIDMQVLKASVQSVCKK